MTTIRAPLSTVLSTVRQQLETEAKEAAKNNLLSKSEQATLADGVLKEAAETIRQEGGSGARVDTDVLVEKATSRMEALIGSVNQPSGSGAVFVSQAEVKALASTHLDAGVRVARAYELITGKKIDLGTTTPVVTPDPVVPVDPVTPPPTTSGTFDLRALMGALRTRIVDEVKAHAGANQVLSQAELAAMPSGFAREAALATSGTRTPSSVADTFEVTVRATLAASGFDTAALTASASGAVPFGPRELLKLAGNAQLSALVVDTLTAMNGERPIFGDRSHVRGHLAKQITRVYAPFGAVISQAERATLPPGLLRDVVDALPQPVRPVDATNAVMQRVRTALDAAGFVPVTDDPNDLEPFGKQELAKLVDDAPEIAGLFADAMASAYGADARPALPQLPAARLLPA
jgi:hypothetical protein